MARPVALYSFPAVYCEVPKNRRSWGGARPLIYLATGCTDQSRFKLHRHTTWSSPLDRGPASVGEADLPILKTTAAPPPCKLDMTDGQLSR